MKRDPNLVYPDNTPVEVPVRLRRAVQEGDRFKELVQRFSEYQARQGRESIEEADDFEVEEDADLDFISGHELTEMQEEGSMRDASFEAKRERYYGPRKSAKRVEGSGRARGEDQEDGESVEGAVGSGGKKKAGAAESGG